METAFVFLDETGRLPVPRDCFFGVGLLKCPEPAEIQRPMQLLRDQLPFRPEIKWSEVRQNTLPIYRRALGCFFDCPNAEFACYISDKNINNPIRRFGNHWTAYERLSAQLLIGNIKPDEMVTLLADEYSSPAGVTFEENVRELVEKRLKRRAVAGVCRMRSTGVDTFQILDLLLGAVAFEYKLDAGLIRGRNPKARLLNHIKDRFGVSTFVGGVRCDRLNVRQFGRSGRGKRAA